MEPNFFVTNVYITSGISLFDMTDHHLRYYSNVLLTNVASIFDIVMHSPECQAMSLISFIFIIYIHTSIHCIDIKRYFLSLISHGLFRSIYITLIFLISFRRQDLYKADVSNQCQIHSRNPVFFKAYMW